MTLIIPRSETFVHAISWQTELSGAINNLQTLLDYTGNQLGQFEALDNIAPGFPLRVPYPYASRIEPGNPFDPLLRQVLPLTIENQLVPGYISDPLDEASSNIESGIIHKYQGRVLLILTGACAIHCRYCFRRHFPYQDNQNSRAQWQQALDYIRNDNSISEVIFSGGDPLLNSDRVLKELVDAIADIAHVQRLRIHTRLPIVIPQRITAELLEWLTATRLQPVLVVHSNHPAEIDNEVSRVLLQLKAQGVTLLNQTVLLKGINDSATTLTHLSERLFAAGVLPYYLHLLDKVQGAAHFDIPAQQAQQLAGQMASRLPGYLMPKLVREVAGKSAKMSLLPLL